MPSYFFPAVNFQVHSQEVKNQWVATLVHDGDCYPSWLMTATCPAAANTRNMQGVAASRVTTDFLASVEVTES
jgi:hypothetical protein